MKLLLLDADILAYRTCAQLEEVIEVEPGYWSWGCSSDKVLHSIRGLINFWEDKLGADGHRICLSDDAHNFRKDVSDTYKAFRQKYRRPVALKAVREELFKDPSLEFIPGLEADDVMGILATDPDRDYEPIIISMDKDMKTIPGVLFRNETEGVQEITTEEADFYHLYQTLIGDPTDGYAGCPGIGAVSAHRLLEKSPTWKTVVDAFAKKGLPYEYALTQARLAKILRHEDFDFETMRPKLWTPKLQET